MGHTTYQIEKLRSPYLPDARWDMTKKDAFIALMSEIYDRQNLADEFSISVSAADEAVKTAPTNPDVRITHAITKFTIKATVRD